MVCRLPISAGRNRLCGQQPRGPWTQPRLCSWIVHGFAERPFPKPGPQPWVAAQLVAHLAEPDRGRVQHRCPKDPGGRFGPSLWAARCKPPAASCYLGRHAGVAGERGGARSGPGDPRAIQPQSLGAERLGPCGGWVLCVLCSRHAPRWGGRASVGGCRPHAQGLRRVERNRDGAGRRCLPAGHAGPA
jgi:hypothetical protein